MRLIHYSRKPNLKAVDPNMQGSGAPSEENRRGVPAVHRSYWYREGTKPEQIVTQGASSVYGTTLNPEQKLYDVYADNDKIYDKLKDAAASRQVNPGIVNQDEYLQAVKDAGYHGFYNSGAGNMSNVVALFHPQHIEHEEAIRPEHHEVAAPLRKSDDDMYNLGHHFIFTTDKPKYPKKVNSSFEDVHDMLKRRGEDVQVVNGHYGGPERSFLIRNPKSVNLLHRLAHAHGQESAIESDGHTHRMYFYNGPRAGKYQEGSGTQWFTEKPDDMYTQVPGSDAYFRHHIDGDKLHEGNHIPHVKKLSFDDPWDQAKHDRGGDLEYARYNDRKNSRLKKSLKDWMIHPQFLNFLDSLKGDHVDESLTGPHYKAYSDTDENGNELKPNDSFGPHADIVDMLRSYKNSPHHPRALALKYLVHRIENADAYRAASPEERDSMDSKFLAHHQKGDASKKNGKVTIHALRKFIARSPQLAANMLDEREKLHDFIRTHAPDSVKMIDGVPSVALTRGLHTKNPGPDHALSSYSDTKSHDFGSHPHHRWVPLKNIWYSYDIGDSNASSEDHGPEDEFLVSPHDIKNASVNDVDQLVPRKAHTYQMSEPAKVKFKIERGDRLDPAEIRNWYNSRHMIPMKLRKQVVNHPDTPDDVVESHVSGNYFSPGDFIRYEHDHVPVKKHSPGVIHKVVSKAIKTDPRSVKYLIRDHGDSMPPETKQLIEDNKSKLDLDVPEKLAASETSSEDLKKSLKGDDHDYMETFVHPHDRHAIKVHAYLSGKPYKDSKEVVEGLRSALASKENLVGLQGSVSKLNGVRQKMYGSGPGDASDFDKHMINADKYDVGRMIMSLNKINRESQESDLNKAIKEEDFTPLREKNENANEALDPEKGFSDKDIDAKSHVLSRPGHDEYVNAMNDPKKVHSTKHTDDIEGISQKMIHKVGRNTYMAKPYHWVFAHDQMDPVRHNAPGWAALTTRDLYDSAGLGHLVEDVKGGMHKGVPLTLHRFEKDMAPKGTVVAEHATSPGSVNQGDLAKIAVMDFLTNNVDRHVGNLLLSKKPDKNGQHKVKAIDHDLAFGYVTDPDYDNLDEHQFKDNLMNYALKSGFDDISDTERVSPTVYRHDYFPNETPELKSWWVNNKDNIKKSFLQSLKHVSNRDLKEHMRKNFMDRARHMDHMVRTVRDDDTMFSDRHPGVEVTKPEWYRRSEDE